MPVDSPSLSSELVEKAHKIGAEIAAPHAAAVDRDARFPTEAFDALRKARMLGAFIPQAFGGMGCSIADLSGVCTALAQYCSATAMIYAMHQIQVACIVRHGQSAPHLRNYLTQLAENEWLIASATTELGVGGDVRTSLCTVERTGDRFALAKKAPVISYAESADDILVTARRAPDAPSSDQVIVLTHKRDMTLEPLSTWDTLGYRGTCSLDFTLTATGHVDQIVPQPYAEISSQTMLPTSHILWSSGWLGIATAAVNRARAYIRAEARKNPGKTPVASVRLAEVVATLHSMRATVNDAVQEYMRVADDVDAVSSMSFAIRMNNLKINCSQFIVDIVSQCMLICGMAGYKIDSQYTLGQHLRDAYGAALMINNDRILGNTSSMLLVSKDD